MGNAYSEIPLAIKSVKGEVLIMESSPGQILEYDANHVCGVLPWYKEGRMKHTDCLNMHKYFQKGS